MLPLKVRTSQMQLAEFRGHAGYKWAFAGLHALANQRQIPLKYLRDNSENNRLAFVLVIGFAAETHVPSQTGKKVGNRSIIDVLRSSER
jgi:hypothetical protein